MSEAKNAATGTTEVDRGFTSDVQRLGQYVGQLHDDLAGIAKGAGEVVQSGLAEVREGGKKTFEAAKRKSEVTTATIRDGMAAHPGATLGIAVGVGILIGLVGSGIVGSRRRAS